MANAITGAIKDNMVVTAKDFLLTCAKVSGPLSILLRDESLSEPLRLRHVSPYARGRVCNAEDRLAEAKTMTLKKAKRAVQRSYEYEVERLEDHKKEAAALRERYENMLEKVKAWEPPTEEHTAVKKTAIRNLEDSIRFDCSLIERYSEPIMQDPQEYIDLRIKWAEEELELAKERLAEEEADVERINTWITTLQESLEGLDESKC
jgi:DNA repair exonuclease SbcCD ATPase subunit